MSDLRGWIVTDQNLICHSCCSRFVGESCDRPQCNQCLNHRVKKLTQALRDIMRHQECIGGDLAKLDVTWQIAEKAVGNE